MDECSKQSILPLVDPHPSNTHTGLSRPVGTLAHRRRLEVAFWRSFLHSTGKAPIGRAGIVCRIFDWNAANMSFVELFFGRVLHLLMLGDFLLKKKNILEAELTLQRRALIAIDNFARDTGTLNTY